MASRKASGGSTRSGPHSPSSTSPGNPHPHNRLTPTQTGAMLGVGMGPSRPLKSLSPTWQVWSGAPKRTVSGSTNASGSDRRSSPNESAAGYRSLSDGWRSGTQWEDVVGGGLKDSIAYDTLTHQSGPRVRQTGPRTPSGGIAVPRVASGAVDSDLARQLRGMAVDDDYPGGQSYNSYTPQVPSTIGPGPGQISPRVNQQPRGAYPGGFAQDYASYQGTSPAREQYSDYAFPYDAYRAHPDPAIYAASSPVAPVFPSAQPTGFFDYSTTMAPAGYYFTSPAMVGPPLAEFPILPADYLHLLKQPHPMAPTTAMVYPPGVGVQSSPHARYGLPPADYSPRMGMAMNSGVVYPSLNAPSPGSYPHRLHPDRRRGGQPTPQGYRDRSTEGPRSAILEDFRANKSRRWELKDILGHVVEFSIDQHGSRFIQHRLDTAGPDVRQKAFDEIVPQHFMALVENVFGNYVIQKLFEHGTGPQKAAMIAAMDSHILQLSLHMYGCRVVQKAIDFVGPDLQGIFVRELKDEVMRCVKDPNGNHVVQKLIERVPPERLSFIPAFIGNVYELASHPYGCRVLQRCLEHLGLDATRPLLDELQKYITDLMQDQFGNYVVQFLCENGEQMDRAIVVEKLRGQMLTMSKHKFASNVVEKALITADSTGRELLIDELMLSGEDGQDVITLMMKDQYANYVLQRAMMHAEGQQQVDLCNRVRPQLVAMRKLSSVYTKHLNSIERCLNKIQRAHALAVSPTSSTPSAHT